MPVSGTIFGKVNGEVRPRVIDGLREKQTVSARMQISHLSLAAALVLASAGALQAADNPPKPASHHIRATIYPQRVDPWRSTSDCAPFWYWDVSFGEHWIPTAMGYAVRPYGFVHWSCARNGGWRD